MSPEVLGVGRDGDLKAVAELMRRLTHFGIENSLAGLPVEGPAFVWANAEFSQFAVLADPSRSAWLAAGFLSVGRTSGRPWCRHR